MATYATPAQLLQLRDARVIGQLAGDNGSTVNPTDLLTDPNVGFALDIASGEIEAALLRGERYSLADLQNLTGNSASLLAYLTCVVAFRVLWDRRPYLQDERRAKAIEEAEEALGRLSSGKDVFNLASQIGAGVPEITGPSLVDLVQNGPQLAAQCYGHIYGYPRLPGGRS